MSTSRSGSQKLIDPKELSRAELENYQKYQRLENKEKFRENLLETLGEEFKKFVVIAEQLRKDGVLNFKDFVDKEKFDKFLSAYDKKMDEASKSQLNYYFLNLQKHIDFLTNPEFKDAFFHPLTIALTAYAMGGPIRLVDVRAKNAEPGLTLERDNGAHVDDSLDYDEWKDIWTFKVDETGRSENGGPQGQPFVCIPNTHRLARKYATEFGANFKNPYELLDVLNRPDLQGQVFIMEAKDQRPLFTKFNASHLIHHRERRLDERKPPIIPPK